ncbi:MAG: hypothetical protein U0X91_07705 [Spirosomataceae bacterium]
MRALLSLLFFVSIISGCKSGEEGPGNLKAAADHCDCRLGKLDWLRDIVISGDYPTPGAKLPAPIRRISLSVYGKEPVILLDSDINACFNCPWAVLNCKGKPFTGKLNATPVRENIIWVRY